MFVLVAATALLLCLGSTARGQADTSRPRPAPAPVIRLRSADSGRALDITAIEVIKGAGTAGLGDRLGPAVRRRMLDTLEAQRRVWDERRPRAYVIRTVHVGHCIIITRRARVGGQVVRDQLVVRDTAVVGRRPAPIAALYAQQCHLAWRVEDLFADVTRALADTMGVRVAPRIRPGVRVPARLLAGAWQSVRGELAASRRSRRRHTR